MTILLLAVWAATLSMFVFLIARMGAFSRLLAIRGKRYARANMRTARPVAFTSNVSSH